MGKRFYFYKLGTDFFEKDEIKLLESQENGEKYILFLMKLMLRSMNDDESRPGRLMFQGKIPYSETLLSRLTNTDIDVVRSSLDIFNKLGIVKGEEDGGAFLEWVGSSVDSETDGAERTRKWRERKRLMIGVSHSDGIASQRDVSMSQSDVTVTSPLYSKYIDSSSLSSGVREDNSGDIGEGPKAKPEPLKPPAIEYNFKDRVWEGITDGMVRDWAEAFPACNVERELTKMAVWLDANPKQRKSNYSRFIVNWLTRAQDKGGTR